MMKTSPRMINRIGSIIKDEGPKGMTLLKNVLTLLSMGYTGAVRTRTVFYKNGVSRSFRLPCMVISVGNLTLGGTGKTPMTLYLAEMLMDFGYRKGLYLCGETDDCRRGARLAPLYDEPKE